MSLGAWIFASAVAASIIAPAGVYAVSNTITAIGNPSGTTAAYVTPTRQLQTVMIAPSNVVHIEFGGSSGNCQSVYTPPAGKAIVVTQITYALQPNTPGAVSYATIRNLTCSSIYDLAQTIDADASESHTFPTGLPMTGVTADIGGDVVITMNGYLIPASQLPPDAPGSSGSIKAMPGRG